MSQTWRTGRWLLLVLGLLLLIGKADRPAFAVGRDQLAKCNDFAFSTEQSFIMQRGEPVDGNRWISDGDLLAPSGDICARNADLTRIFSPTGAPLPDLGLDAVDIIYADTERYLVAFSTEIDHPRGTFLSGDLVATNGMVIPNVALVAAAFGAANQTPYDVGLDELKFIGKIDDIRQFIEFAKSVTRAQWLENPRRLREELTRYQVDIWFSTEESAQTPNFTVVFLDGDILSAKTGARVVPQDALLSPPIPAGIPTRGVDFGNDAFAVDRNGSRASMLFSTEIGYTSDVSPTLRFTDGDVLKLAGFGSPVNQVVYKNYDLIKNFYPAAKDLGLDVLYRGSRNPEDSKITALCNEPTLDFDGGDVSIGSGGSGLYYQNLGIGTPTLPRRPCGAYVPIDGTVPAGATRFRVAYRLAGTPRPAYGVAPAIPTEWWVNHRDLAWLNFCYTPTSSVSPFLRKLMTTAAPAAWMDASDYLDAKNGTGSFSDGCVNAELRLAVWDSTTAPDPNGHYVVWLEWDDAGGSHQENADHHIQLDNKAPTRAPGSSDPVVIQLRYPDGVIPLPQCGQLPADVSTIQVWAQFDDPYYYYFDIFMAGGNPATTWTNAPYPNYFDINDGTLGLKNTNDTGTTPDGITVHLRDIDMAAAFGDSFKNCCYYFQIRVWDAAMRYSFSHTNVNIIDPHYALQFQTFAAGAP